MKLQWLPQGASSTFSKTITIAQLSFVHSGDFVAEILGQTGLGAILVSGVTSSGDPDSTAALYAQSQIWTPQPGTSGTTSQTFPVIPTNTINTKSAGLLFPRPARDVSSYRHNIGIVNLDPVNAQTINIALPSIIPFNVPVTVPPMGMQVALMEAANPFPELMLDNLTPSATKSNLWVAWGSTIDNITGDAWSELAVVNEPGLVFATPIGKE